MGSFCPQQLRELLDSAANVPYDGSNTAKLGAIWCSAMDTDRIERDKLLHLQPLRDAIRGVTTSKEYLQLLGRMRHFAGVGLLDFSGVSHPAQSERVILWVSEGGIGLPNRDYYLNPEHAAVRDHYRLFIGRMLRLGGYLAADAEAAATKIMVLETALAKARSVVARDDPGCGAPKPPH